MSIALVSFNGKKIVKLQLNEQYAHLKVFAINFTEYILNRFHEGQLKTKITHVFLRMSGVTLSTAATT